MSFFNSIARQIDGLGIKPGDDDDLVLQKRIQVRAPAMMAVMGLFWAAIYWFYAEPLAALFPFSFALISFASLLGLVLSLDYSLFRFSQLACYLLLPFFLMIALGGFINSSAVVLWSLTAPLGALLFADRRQALNWFIAFLCLVAIGAIYEVIVPPQPNNLPPIVIRAFFVLNLTMCSLVIFATTTYFVRGKGEALDQVEIERARSEHLLSNILPGSIAERLKAQDRPIADRLDNVSILFADIVGFTEFTNTHPPEEVVDLLDRCFTAFDDLADRHGLEKIKTIGDSYMVAGGLPQPDPDHAVAIANFALDARDFLEQRPATSGLQTSLRIGIHSGSVVAGVIGKRKFSYDIWGDAVNLAARLEAACPAGAILVSQATRDLLRDTHHLDDFGSITLKGIGEQRVFLLKSRA